MGTITRTPVQQFSLQQYVGCREVILAFVAMAGEFESRITGSGNPCELYRLPEQPESSAQTTADMTVCQSWPVVHDDKMAIAVRCYTALGQSIQCCGHGLLAAAHSWQQRLQRDELPLLTNGSRVLSWQQQGNTWLRFERAVTFECALPHWLPEVFPNQPLPIAAATCGARHGYLILQWPDNFNLHQLAPPHACLTQRSQRALICTSANPRAGEDAIQLRYFAPQYAVDEDTATGSAMRVLADYWSPRYTRLTARQYSPIGGLLLANVTPRHAEVGGRCSIVDTAWQL